MPLNKNALIRYRTIDECLVNRQRKWTLQDLIDACSAALTEYEGPTQVSKRTLQLDIQHMRSGKLGYEAPIVVIEKKYYTYSDPKFSITRIPISKGELNHLKEAVSLLKQFAGFKQFEEIEEVVNRLADKIELPDTSQSNTLDIQKNVRLKGLEWLTPLHEYITNHEAIQLTYQPFYKPEAAKHEVHPYLLKEYNDRWYLLAYSQYERRIIAFGVDRIKQVSVAKDTLFIPNTFFDPSTYFQHSIGVTVYQDGKPLDIVLYVFPFKAPYLNSKPLHHSQQLLHTFPDGACLLKLHLMINYELINRLLSEGPDVLVLKPIQLRNRVTEFYEKGLKRHQDKVLRARIWTQLNKLDIVL